MSGNPGYGSGWDVILPTNWAMPFWIALVYRGAKAAGLRDLHSLSVEAGNLAFPDCCPDTAAASETSRRRSDELRAAYERRPPAKRCNYEKLGVAAPFHCPWSDLVRGWSTNAKDGVFYCLRSRKWLLKLAEYPRRRGIHASKSSDVPLIGSPGVVDLPADPNCCIVQITIRMLGRGVPSRFALICLPSEGDLKGLGIGKIKSRNANAVAKLVEPIHSRPTADAKDCTKSDAQPTAAVDVVNIASRRTFGFVVEGGFSHALGYGFGIGFVAFPGLMEVLQRQRPAVVLIRTTSSLHYHAAELSLIV